MRLTATAAQTRIALALLLIAFDLFEVHAQAAPALAAFDQEIDPGEGRTGDHRDGDAARDRCERLHGDARGRRSSIRDKGLTRHRKKRKCERKRREQRFQGADQRIERKHAP